MSKTVSGHEAIKSWSSPLLAARKIPGTNISLRTRRSCLPLFLHLAARLDEEVKPLSKRNTWSFNYRPIRMGQSAVSDHAGYAIDCWSDDIGAHTWPSKMSATKAKKISRILESYKTRDGAYIFGWGASSLAPGVDYKGPTHRTQKGNDPMHFFIAPGITNRDLMQARKSMGVRLDGTVRAAKSEV
jgi:hypothetical protein